MKVILVGFLDETSGVAPRSKFVGIFSSVDKAAEAVRENAPWAKELEPHALSGHIAQFGADGQSFVLTECEVDREWRMA